MPFQTATSPHAIDALVVVRRLQSALVARLEQASQRIGHVTVFEPVHWLRDDGQHGGGTRWVARPSKMLSRASVNISAIQYDDLPDKRLSSATALSTIVHPSHPHAPSMHMHISWTELRDGRGYWRLMADLNPSIANDAHTERFCTALASVLPSHREEARLQGDKYFFIPALDRHRGVAHFYLEGHNTGDWNHDAAQAEQLGNRVIQTYAELVEDAFQQRPDITEADRAAQLAYHTLYLFQVLTLDRGTTSGLLVHSQNDLGIMGSLPAFVDADLLRSWRPRVPEVQRALVDALAQALTPGHPSPVDPPAKLRLAQAVRDHYRANPQALSLQASGNTIPPTVSNHR